MRIGWIRSTFLRAKCLRTCCWKLNARRKRSRNTKWRSRTRRAASTCCSALLAPRMALASLTKRIRTMRSCLKCAEAPETVLNSPKPARWQHTTEKLEVKAQFGGIAPRRDEVRSAECAQEVVQRFFVRQIDHCEAQAPFVAVAMEQIVVANGQVEKIAGGDARRILVVVFRAFSWDVNAGSASLRGTGSAAGGRAAQWIRQRSEKPLPRAIHTEKPDCSLLIAVER